MRGQGRGITLCQAIAFCQVVEVKYGVCIELGQDAGFIGTYGFAAQQHAFGYLLVAQPLSQIL
ncbi:hypothetical protein A2T76_07660 [Pseudomonas brenneri]|nr:hypothetical protein A2T76_07660 [Pseudomonas brenneri]